MRNFNFLGKFLSAVAVVGLTTTSGIPALDARTVAPTIPYAHPVNCSLFSRVNQERPYYSRHNGTVKGRYGSTLPPAPPPPPPPPPAPPPPPGAVNDNNIVVTGNKKPSMALESASPVSVASQSRSQPVSKNLTRIAPYPYPRPFPHSQGREKYDGKNVANIKSVANEPVSTFAVDVDTGSYSNVRRFLKEGRMPPEAAVRTEEMINYFRYDYPRPTSRKTPFSVTTNVSTTPWNDASRLMRIGLRGYDVNTNERPRANLVFLIDVSGSMNSQDKLPLVKSTLTSLANELRSDDRVSIIVYSGRVGRLLAPTSNKKHVKEAVDCLYASGSTAGGDALKTAYSTARENFISGGINRIIMATDGDFNVGTSNTDQLKKIVAKERESGVNLTMLGYGRGNIRDELMEGIANVGNGNYAYIDSAMEAKKVLGDELSSTLFTIAKDVKIQVEFNPAHIKEYRLIGYENRLLAEEDFNNDKIDAGDIGAGHQVTALYEVMPANAEGWLPERRYPANRVVEWQPDFNGEMANVKLRYKLPNGTKSRLISRQITASNLKNAAAPRGDMAFAVAVAAFGQKLRGDKYLGDYNFQNINSLTGNSGSYWRQEFRKLNELAGNQSAS